MCSTSIWAFVAVRHGGIERPRLSRSWRHAARIPHGRSAPGEAPTLILLHEGLGCVAMWGDFPDKLAGRDWLRRVRLFAARLRAVEPGEAAAQARFHARRGAQDFAAPARRDRLPARSAGRPQRRRVDRSDLWRQRAGPPHGGTRFDVAAFHRRGRHQRFDRRGPQGLRHHRPEPTASGASTPTATPPCTAGPTCG